MLRSKPLALLRAPTISTRHRHHHHRLSTSASHRHRKNIDRQAALRTSRRCACRLTLNFFFDTTFWLQSYAFSERVGQWTGHLIPLLRFCDGITGLERTWDVYLVFTGSHFEFRALIATSSRLLLSFFDSPAFTHLLAHLYFFNITYRLPLFANCFETSQQTSIGY